MAYQTGTATDYKDLLLKLKLFLTTANVLSAVVPGTNVGNGTVGTLSADNSAPTETWTLTATTVGPGATFTVSGSVSGAQAAATSAVAYDNGIVAFTIGDGGVNYDVGDSFTFDVTKVMGDEIYTVKEWNTDWDGSGNHQLNLMGPGSGSDQIYTGIVTKHSVSQDWYNWYLNGYTGYTVGADWYSHPGSRMTAGQGYLYGPSMRLWNNNMKYWFIANGRRYIVIVNVSTTYQTMYMGYLLPYGLPTQFPYPLFIGGAGYQTLTNADYYQRYSGTMINFNNFWDGYGSSSGGSGFILDGAWIPVGNNEGDDYPSWNSCNVWPYLHCFLDYPQELRRYNTMMKKLKKNLDGTYPLLPCMIHGRSGGNIYPNTYGELQGVYAIPGDGIVSEDTITISGKTYLVVHNCFRTALQNYAAFLLE